MSPLLFCRLLRRAISPDSIFQIPFLSFPDQCHHLFLRQSLSNHYNVWQDQGFLFRRQDSLMDAIDILLDVIDVPASGYFHVSRLILRSTIGMCCCAQSYVWSFVPIAAVVS